MDTLSPSPVCVRVLGGFELIGAGGGGLTLTGRKLRALVALLALPPSLGWSRERLTAVLWGDREEELARGSLRQALAELRRLLGDGALLTDRDTVAFDPAAVTVDAAEFCALCAASQWERAALVYRGDLLSGVSLPNGAFADWLLVEQTRLHDLAVRALGQMLDHQEGEAAVATAQRLLALDPDREDIHRSLMRLYSAAGDRSQALKQYQLCRDHLQRDLGVKPAAETELLFQELRQSPAARGPAPASQPPAPQPPESTAVQPVPARRGWHRSHQVAAGLAAVAVALGVWLFAPATREPADGSPASVLVLPFENMSDDAQQLYFADGIAEDLMTDLSQVKGLTVIARNSAFGYRDRAVDIPETARTLGIRYVIEGSVRRAGDQVRINVQLIDAASGNQQWADRYDGSLTDIFALQDRVTGAVADAMALRLTAGEQRALAQHETTSLEAYDAFLRGWDRYKRATPADLIKALPFFEQAIELDAGYGRAHAAMAMIYFQAYDQAWTGSLGISADDVYRKARDHLTIAQKHPNSTAHQVAGSMYRALGWRERAIKEFDAAIALDPTDSWSYVYAAHTWLAAGDVAKAETQIQIAMRLDPHPPTAFVFYQGMVEYAQGRLQQAGSTFEQAARLSPQDPLPRLLLVATYGATGDRARAQEALAAFNALRARQGGIPLVSDCYYVSNLGSFSFGQNGLWIALRAAGVPRWFDEGTFEPQRVRAAEIDALFVGNRLHGRSLETGEEHGLSVAADGTGIIFGDWGVGSGHVRFEGDDICFETPIGYINCATIYRNPDGAQTTENEYIWVNRKGGAYPFSIVR
jgi:adenylate cyclase